MKKQTYKLIVEAIQLLAILLAVIAITIVFTAISRALNPEARESLQDEIQIGRMQDYHQSQDKVNYVYY